MKKQPMVQPNTILRIICRIGVSRSRVNSDPQQTVERGCARIVGSSEQPGADALKDGDAVGSRVRITAAACLVASGLLAGGASASVAFADPVSSGDAGDKHTNDSVGNGSAEKPKSGFDEKKTPPPGDGKGGQPGTDPVHHPKAGSENKAAITKTATTTTATTATATGATAATATATGATAATATAATATAPATATATTATATTAAAPAMATAGAATATTTTAPAMATAATATAQRQRPTAMATAGAATAGETRQTQAIATRRTRTTARPVGRGGRGLSASLRDLAAAAVAVAATPRCRPAIPAFRRVCSFRRS